MDRLKKVIVACCVGVLGFSYSSTARADALYSGDLMYSINFPDPSLVGFAGPLLSSGGDRFFVGSGSAQFAPFTLDNNNPSFKVNPGTANGSTGPGVGSALSFAQATLGARLVGSPALPPEGVIVVFTGNVTGHLMTQITDPMLDSSSAKLRVSTSFSTSAGTAPLELSVTNGEATSFNNSFQFPVHFGPLEVSTLTATLLVSGAANTVVVPPVPPAELPDPPDRPNPVPTPSSLSLSLLGLTTVVLIGYAGGWRCRWKPA